MQAQTTQATWRALVREKQEGILGILTTTCPRHMNILEYKQALIRGTVDLPDEAIRQIGAQVKSLQAYGAEVAKKYNLPVDADDPESDYYFYAGISPDNPVADGVPLLSRAITTERGAGNWQDCVVSELGMDALAMFSQSTASSWSWPVIRRTFKSVAKKMPGPIGVAIAVIDFGICMAGL